MDQDQSQPVYLPDENSEDYKAHTWIFGTVDALQEMFFLKKWKYLMNTCVITHCRKDSFDIHITPTAIG